MFKRGQSSNKNKKIQKRRVETNSKMVDLKQSISGIALRAKRQTRDFPLVNAAHQSVPFSTITRTSLFSHTSHGPVPGRSPCSSSFLGLTHFIDVLVLYKSFNCHYTDNVQILYLQPRFLSQILDLHPNASSYPYSVIL